ncbi:hypothetical protein Bpfe_005947, partial [Biomphalaria pfeifferi]
SSDLKLIEFLLPSYFLFLHSPPPFSPTEDERTLSKNRESLELSPVPRASFGS